MAEGKRSKKKKTSSKPKTEYVYVCNGPNSYAYHSTPYCSGLNRCSTSVKKVKASSVRGRKPCKKCH
ncbi:MAG: hypothetical protein HDS42_06245 [Bacteroides sp.]|nr:hypothetical protein [Bacteroides sp.]